MRKRKQALTGTRIYARTHARTHALYCSAEEIGWTEEGVT